ncbi:ABC transporter substrate-binding protein [Pilimelia columellifera]|uniref:Basic amino acid ABC transporter substrate-binding protein n=1 Tax=Pilimelia columellifera subsp. columellifera TaxID=706583 RepID=A0ABN3NBS6_9ACTN
MTRTTRAARRALLVPALLALVIAAGACTKKDDGGATDAGVPLVKAGQLTTCTHLPYPPFQDKVGGKYVGFDVALIDLVARKLNVKQEIVDTPFEGIKSGQDLNSGKCDVAAAGMTITEDRKKVLAFSDPYFDATQALLIGFGQPFTRLEDLANKTVGVQAQTTGEDYLKKRVAKQGLKLEIKSYRDLAGLQQALGTRQIAGAVNDLPVWNNLMKNNAGKFVVVEGYDTGEQYGFAVKKGGDPRLLATINEVIAAAKADGAYDALYNEWIGKKPTA